MGTPPDTNSNPIRIGLGYFFWKFCILGKGNKCIVITKGNIQERLELYCISFFWGGESCILGKGNGPVITREYIGWGTC